VSTPNSPHRVYVGVPVDAAKVQAFGPVSVTFVVMLLSAFRASPERSVSNGYFNAAAFLFVFCILRWLAAFIALYN